jgi:hypothetical protein
MFSIVIIEGITMLIKTVYVKDTPVHYVIDPHTGIPTDVIELK